MPEGTPKKKEKPTLISTLKVNREHAVLHLAILGNRPSYLLTVKNHATGKGWNETKAKDEIIPFAEEMNNRGFCVWVSINSKEKDGIEGVTSLDDFWIDIDARPRKKKNDNTHERPATKEELEAALKRAVDLQNHIEKEYCANGFLAYSGNGYHLHFPLPQTALAKEVREDVNLRVRAFAKTVSATVNAEIDSTYDISRKTTLIGSFNLKLVDTPLHTSWAADILSGGIEAALKFVEKARIQNDTLAMAILSTPVEEEKEPIDTEQEAVEHPDLAAVLEKEPTLKDVYNGDWEKYNYVSKSEAEYAFVIALVQYGFKPAAIREAMKNSKVGKWNDPKTADGYRDKTLTKAFKFVKEKDLKPKTTEAKKQTEPKENQADRLVRLCISQQPTFFHDQHKTPYMRVRQAGINVIMPIRSRQFKSWLANLMWLTEQKVPGTEGLNSAINVLQGKALLEGEQYTLYNRVAPADDGVWIDMADDKWRAIKVDAQGWRIVNDPSILFRRYSHQLPLAEPIPGGDPWKLLDYLNIDKKDEDTQLTLMCNCASYYIPLIPHPILVLYGIQGSGKTWVFVILRRVFDPSSIEVLSMPRDERERVQQLDHHWLAFYDNITSMPSWVSDSLCRAATGGGFTKRELYSDDEDVIYNFKRCVGLNGINIAAQRGDLLDRSLLVGLEHIPNKNRKTEQKLLADFEKEKASILGGFLDVLVKAIQLYPTINPDRLFRMADFTRWGCAIAKALGKTTEEFIMAYESKVKSQIEEAAHASPVATVLLDYLEKKLAPSPSLENWEGWEGTPTALFKTLLEHAKTLDISTRQKGWPKAPHVLVRQLNELAPALKSLGWEVVASRTGRTRRIGINCVTSVIASQDHENNGENSDASLIHKASPTLYGKTPSNDACDSSDAFSTSSLGSSRKQGVAFVSHVKVSEQCYNGCPLLAEWQIEIGTDFKQLFCNGCFDKAKRDLEQNGFEVQFKEAS